MGWVAKEYKLDLWKILKEWSNQWDDDRSGEPQNLKELRCLYDKPDGKITSGTLLQYLKEDNPNFHKIIMSELKLDTKVEDDIDKEELKAMTQIQPKEDKQEYYENYPWRFYDWKKLCNKTINYETLEIYFRHSLIRVCEGGKNLKFTRNVDHDGRISYDPIKTIDMKGIKFI